MCAILDNDVVHQVFGQNRPAAGRAFFDWIDSGGGGLVGGGRLFKELARNENFRRWWPLLVDAFDLDEIVVLDLQDGRTTARRPDTDEYRRWLDEGFMPGELWQKNLIGGRP